MQYIIKREDAVASIFQPFLGRLIAANVEFPCSERNVVEILRIVYPYTAQLTLGVCYFPIFTHYAVGNLIGSLHGVASYEIVYCGRFQQMYLSYLTAQIYQLPKRGGICGVGHTWKIYFQELFVLLAVQRAVQHSIDIV